MTEQHYYIKSFNSIILLTISILLIYMTLVYVIDPLQQYRLARFYKPVFSNELYFNPGVSKYAKYDTVIIGTSTSENFKPSIIKKISGMQAIKLTLNGANSYEEKIILETALKFGKVKQVIYGLDYFSFSRNTPRQGFPFYLYHADHLTDKLQYLISIDNVAFFLQTIEGNLSQQNVSQDEAYSWDATARYSEESVMRDWVISLKSMMLSSNTLDITSLNTHFDNNILTIIKKYPRVYFYLFYPPYSTLQYKKMSRMNDLFTYLQFKKHIFEVTKNLPNVKVYDFQVDTQIIKNLNNYKDLVHYSGKISNYIVENFKNNKYVVTKDNIQYFLSPLLYQNT